MREVFSHRFAAILLILAFAALVTLRLDNTILWDDEAHVALFAHNFLATHTATAWDGRNLVPDSNGAAMNDRLQIHFVQLDNYVVAAFFALFGESPWTGRLAMALCGIAAMIVFWRLLRLEFPSSPSLCLYALAASVFSVNLLLYCRNCRYYALSILLTLLVFHQYRTFLNRRNWLAAVSIGLCGGLLFWSNVLNAVSVLGALAIRHGLFHRRDLTRRDWMKFGAAGALLAVLVLPYLFTCVLPAMEMGRKFDPTLHETPAPNWTWARPVIFAWNLQGMSSINAIPWTLSMLLGAFLVRARRSPSVSGERAVAFPAWEFTVTLLGFAFVLALATPQNIFRASIPEVRYLTPVLPLMALLIGVALWFVHRRSPVVAVGLLVVLISCNALGLAPGVPFQWMLPAWLRETCSPYPTGCSEAVAFLKQNAQQDDTVWTCPAYMGKPLMLYVGSRIKLRGVVDRNTVLGPEPIRRIQALDPALFKEAVFPTWIVAFGKHPQLSEALELFSRPHLENGTRVAYAYHLEKTLDLCWKQTQRPEMVWHSFGPQRDFDRGEEAVYIYRSEKGLIVGVAAGDRLR